jgi:hypothetical protein
VLESLIVVVDSSADAGFDKSLCEILSRT